MNEKCDQCFAKLKVEQKKAFIAYLSAGDPDLPSTLDIVLRLDQGVDVIELGLPFSDPLADGRVNQRLQRGAKRGLHLMVSWKLFRKFVNDHLFQLFFMRGFDQAIKAGPKQEPTDFYY